MLFQPAVKCCLRLLQKTDSFRKAGLRCGVQSEALCRGIERCRYRDGYLLLFETDPFTSKPRVPRCTQVFKQKRGRSNRRNSFLDGNLVRSPGQKCCGSIHQDLTPEVLPPDLPAVARTALSEEKDRLGAPAASRAFDWASGVRRAQSGHGRAS